MTLDEFFEQLDLIGDTVPLQALKENLCEVTLESDDVTTYLRFDNGKYQRNLLNRTPRYEALLLCFEPGQQTPIHDHAGSACGVRVITGVATEVGYKPDTTGCLVEVGTGELPAGGVVGSNDMDIHSLGNLQSNERLVTLHVYSPPLGEVGNYSLEDNSKTFVTAETREAN